MTPVARAFPGVRAGDTGSTRAEVGEEDTRRSDNCVGCLSGPLARGVARRGKGREMGTWRREGLSLIHI